MISSSKEITFNFIGPKDESGVSVGDTLNIDDKFKGPVYEFGTIWGYVKINNNPPYKIEKETIDYKRCRSLLTERTRK